MDNVAPKLSKPYGAKSRRQPTFLMSGQLPMQVMQLKQLDATYPIQHNFIHEFHSIIEHLAIRLAKFVTNANGTNFWDNLTLDLMSGCVVPFAKKNLRVEKNIS